MIDVPANGNVAYKSNAITFKTNISIETKAITRFVQERSISLTNEQKKLLENNLKINNQQAKEILGNYYNDFAQWYEKMYMKSVLPQNDKIEAPKMVDMNAEVAFMEAPKKDISKEKEKALKIGNQVYRKAM